MSTVLTETVQDSTQEDYYWANKEAREFLSRGYLQPGQTLEERAEEIARGAEKYLWEGFADKFLSYFKKGYYSLASPVWSNFNTDRGLPISCNGSYVADSIAGIMSANTEISAQTKYGSGTSAYFGDIRPRGSEISSGGHSTGVLPFLEIFETTVRVVAQSNVRRGNCAAYLDVEHGDIEEFLNIRTDGHPIQDLSFGVCIGNKWMQSMLDGDPKKRDIWCKIIRRRFESGYPYLFFSDNANDQAPNVYKNKRRITHSNLCAEISLPDNEEESFVCCLSSMNLLHYDEWKNTDAVETLIYFMDTLISEYIDKTKDIPDMQRSYSFAKNHRALGMGVLGWASYLRQNRISFDSMAAKLKNVEIFQLLEKRAYSASQRLSALFGEPKVLKGHGRRNTTLMAIAPTTSSSFILGQVSPSIEPLNSNYFVKRNAKGSYAYKCPYLTEELEEYGLNNDETWKSILMHGGSVQHLDFPTKDVFKTFGEISQREIIIQAAQRQKYIDQGQSLNLMIPPNADPADVSDLMIEAWELGLKSLYYQRSSNPSQELARSILTCTSCEG
jgi:ribonucleoside-diphosphate reductase alpha chain